MEQGWRLRSFHPIATRDISDHLLYSRIFSGLTSRWMIVCWWATVSAPHGIQNQPECFSFFEPPGTMNHFHHVAARDELEHQEMET